MWLSLAYLSATEALLHAWVHASYEVDLEGIEARIIADDEFKKNLDISDDDEYERVVSLLVDFLEYVGVAGPIDIVINQLLDHAKSAIIRNSLTKAEAETALGEVIKGLWLLDIGATGGNDAFGNAMKNMPPAMFLRAVITQILVFRARWKHPKKNTRYALLDAAEVLVRPLNPHLDKGELRRLIDRTPLDP